LSTAKRAEDGSDLPSENILHALDFARSHGFDFCDVLIVAAALAADCDRLLTEDSQASRRVNCLVVVNPFT